MAEAEASRVRNGYASNGSGPRPAQAVRECSYSEFLKCKPLDFKGTEGVVGLTRWFEKMESVFSISNCTASCQVKFATCTLQDDALTWWNKQLLGGKPDQIFYLYSFSSTIAEKTELRKKRKFENTSQNNQNPHQQQNNRQNKAMPTLQAIVTGKSINARSKPPVFQWENPDNVVADYVPSTPLILISLFDTGADSKFCVYSAFSPKLTINPSTLTLIYVELADEEDNLG
ncbi:hypothetical protein Tco_0989162 [Tanacetum coccineum]|uniref:Reverse transcriptase domain-containing protein n=1 Tax=Tanacetum coccineum TaxID=301880 RepID=A0ABQ5ETK3_9ASTR